MSDSWSDYQEDAADFFRGLGLNAETNITIKGTRTSHAIDVVVRSHHVGFDIMWLVECKHWQVRVSKLHVLALRQIVVEVGADRGILLCEAGFQSGAIEASNLTNVSVMSLAECQSTASDQINSMRMRELYDRIEVCRHRYWDIPKIDRIESGLRPDIGVPGYSGRQSIDLVVELLSRAFRGAYPFNIDSLAALVEGVPLQFNSSEEVLAIVDPMVSELEGKLDEYDNRPADSS